MFSRVTWSQAATTGQEQIEKSLGFYRQRILPSLQTQVGFLGAVVLVNRETGDGASVTYWESGEALAASEAMSIAARVEVAQAANIILKDVDRFEMLLQDRAKPAQAGSFVRVNDVVASSGQIDAMINWMRDTALPAIRPLSGYRAMLISANRATGRMLVASTWDTAADREASEAVIGGLRRQLTERAQSQSAVRVSLYEGVLAEVSQAAQQSTTAKAGAA
jgi:heme-degrading monooxygenase HmoA